jgi:hypothetical protein
MTVREVVVTWLKSVFGEGKVFVQLALQPNQTYPIAIYQFVGGDYVQYVDNKLSDLEEYRVQVWVWSKKQSDADVKLQSAITQLQTLTTVKAFQINGMPIDIHEHELGIYGRLLDVTLWYESPPPTA